MVTEKDYVELFLLKHDILKEYIAFIFKRLKF
jgi:hypothetical protein